MLYKSTIDHIIDERPKVYMPDGWGTTPPEKAPENAIAHSKHCKIGNLNFVRFNENSESEYSYQLCSCGVGYKPDDIIRKTKCYCYYCY